MIPQFLRFYGGYTVAEVLNEYATVFFSLVNSMYRLEAVESMSRISENALPNMSKKDAEKAINDLQTQAKGISGILDEVRVLKNV